MVESRRTNYEEIALLYDADRQTLPPEDDALADIAKPGTGTTRVLDVGCGTGNYLRAQATRLCNAPIVWFGVDPSPAMLAVARGKIRAFLVRGEAEDLPFAARSFDVVFCGWAFHHFRDKARAVKSIARVVAPGGCFRLRNVEPWSMERWWMYRFFPATASIDRDRFWPVARLVSACQAEGLLVKASVHTTAQAHSAAELLARAERRVISQLAVLDEAPYQDGMSRLRAAAERSANIDSESAELTLTATRM